MMFTVQRFQATDIMVLGILGPNKMLEDTTSKKELTTQQSDFATTWLAALSPNPGHLSLYAKSSSFHPILPKI